MNEIEKARLEVAAAKENYLKLQHNYDVLIASDYINKYGDKSVKRYFKFQKHPIDSVIYMRPESVNLIQDGKTLRFVGEMIEDGLHSKYESSRCSYDNNYILDVDLKLLVLNDNIRSRGGHTESYALDEISESEFIEIHKQCIYSLIDELTIQFGEFNI
jgi:hypothetical protein